ncbi:GGDEF domain-containing protein [Piscinibacter sp.]|uniref:GGDEF domain-containing protein n=1 Tax=Piscinibacter sp. TaxID=1903157 RepID=UPI0039E385A3
MEATTIAWVLPHADFDDEAAFEPLRAHGVRVLPCAAGAALPAEAGVRVLRCALFGDARRLRREYLLDARPTLIVADTAEQEAEALEFLKARDDVVRGLHPVELLLLRLARLLKHAGGEARLHSLQFTDELTGLANRKRWQALLTQALAASDAPDECRAVVLFDLDHFKQINDRFGHQAGDQVLRESAALLLDALAPGDRLARWGGEEFAALLTRYDRATIAADVQRMLQRLAEHVFVAPAAGGSGFERLVNRFDDSAAAPLDGEPMQRIAVSASAGLAFVRERSSFADLMSQADVALYEAKSRGRNRLVSYEALQDGAGGEERDLYVRHFENVTRVLTERMTTLVTNMGRSLVEAARREANQDALTQLHNRRYFDARLAREVETAHKRGRALSLALIDLDHFHDVNATYGYPSGDQVLRRFAEIARHGVRLTDWLARYGGEEFCLVMPDTDRATAERVAERVRAQVAAAEILSVDQRRVALTASVGVAQLGAGDDPLTLVQRASEAVLSAKRAGRNRLGTA